MVFASLVSQLQPKLREALISSGLDDPGLLRAYPRSPVEDLRAMGLGMAMVTSTSSSFSFPPSVSSSFCSGVEGTVSRPSTILSQGQGTVGTVPEICKKAAIDLSLHTTSTLRPRGPERRRIMKKGSTLQTGVTDGSHVPLDGWTHIPSSSTVSPTFSPCLLGSSSHVSVELAVSSEVGGTSQSDPQGPLISADHVETHKSPLKSDVSQSRDLHSTSAGSTVELEVRGNSSLLQQVSSPTCSAQNQWTDEVILYFTLVADKVIPDGFLFDFLHMSQWISSAAHRQAARLARVTDVEAALFVHSVQTKVKDQALEQKAAVDTFVAAASIPPTRYKSRLHLAKFQGPSARRDAEESERQRWLQLLANLIVGTDTPMGRLLQSRQGDISLLGAGRRAGTLRSRVRNIRHFLAWLAVNHGITYPTRQTHLTDFMQVRLSEPCNRGSLKLVHESFIFVDIVSGLEPNLRLTSSQLYITIYRELMTKALPGKLPRQAPRMFSSMLKALEQLVMSVSSPVYFRIYAWWTCIQSWATLRFDDHRGINPRDIRIDSSSFSATLTRGKTIGEDKAIRSRPLIIDSESYLHSRSWITTGWNILKETAGYERDYLLPSPSTNYHGVTRTELRYSIAHAMLGRVLGTLTLDGIRLFPFQIQQYWTPHSSRALLPSATLILDFPKSQRDFLGGWNPQASDRYARTARRAITAMQKAVVRAIHSRKTDPLSEQDLAEHFEQYLSEQRPPQDSIAQCVSSLRPQFSIREIPEPVELSEDVEQVPAPIEVPTQIPQIPHPAVKRQRRTEILGSNPKERRAQIRDMLEPGFYLCRSGKKRIRTVHRLGHCFALPGVDYFDYDYLGLSLPKRSGYDVVCGLCSKKDAQHVRAVSSASQSSSSTDQDQ